MNVEHQIIKWLAYFDIFSHPLTEKELVNLCNISEREFKSVSKQLLSEGKCYRSENYYSIQREVKTVVKQRLHKEQEAQKYFKKLPFYAKLIRRFPFVKGVAISGSLSKSVMYDDGDIDYFIVTDKNRLWIARTFLVIFKKLFLLNSRKYFCVNYFVDENNLQIADENVFTAIEITYLAPVYNAEVFRKLKKQNNWTNSYIPDFKHPLELDEYHGDGFLKKVFQFLFIGKLGDRLDTYFMKLTYKRWQKKFKDFPKEKFDQTMRTNRGISKHHPRDFQNKVLREYKSRLAQFNITE